MTIKSRGGVFGRNPTFNNVDVDGTLSIAGAAIPAPADTLVSSDIGSTVQAYDADTAKLDVVQTFTANQSVSGNFGVGTSSLPYRLMVSNDGPKKGLVYSCNSLKKNLIEKSGSISHFFSSVPKFRHSLRAGKVGNAHTPQGPCTPQAPQQHPPGAAHPQNGRTTSAPARSPT